MAVGVREHTVPIRRWKMEVAGQVQGPRGLEVFSTQSPRRPTKSLDPSMQSPLIALRQLIERNWRPVRARRAAILSAGFAL